MNITVRVWRQSGPDEPGKMVSYDVPDVSEHMSFLEMLDVLNERLTLQGDDPIAFDSDCREGICGMCGVVINGIPHGRGVPGADHHLPAAHALVHRRCRDRHRAVAGRAVPGDQGPGRRPGCVRPDHQAGGFISAPTGSATEANATPVPKAAADHAFDAATCIGCGACVAACPNGSAMLFTAAKVTHLGLLPQGQPERKSRVVEMVHAHDDEGFGACTNIGECTAVCPKGIPLETISRLNRDLLSALVNPQT